MIKNKNVVNFQYVTKYILMSYLIVKSKGEK